MTRHIRDVLLLLAAALIIAGLALYGARYREDQAPSWREDIRVDYV